MAGDPWQIDRFDLIFYNPRHKRWQFFAEDPSAADPGLRNPEESLHRYLIHSLLGTFRRAVRSTHLNLPAEKQSLFGFRTYSPNFVQSADRDIKWPTKNFNEWKDYKDIYLEYLIRTAWYDGIPKEHRSTLQNWFKDETTKISREAALTFLSLLPILEDWDTWGCFVRARDASCKRLDQAFPPSILRDWSEPLYVVDLEFSDDPGKDHTVSKQLLGYHISIEGMYLDLAEIIPVIHKSTKADFFDEKYCKDPRNNQEEAIAYRLYAALCDPILKRLAGAQDGNHQFVIAYPISVAGRLHFLQIGVSPPRNSHSCIDTLWNDWQAIHHALWTPVFKGFLREEMHRIIGAAFQWEIYAHLAEEIKGRGENPDLQNCRDELYRHIYQLFPVTALRTPRGAFCYRPYRFPKGNSSDSILVGMEWEGPIKVEKEKSPIVPELSLSDHPAFLTEERRALPVNVGKEEVQIVPELSFSDGIDSIMEGHRVRSSIYQQREYIDRLHEGLQKERRSANEDRSLAYAVVARWAQKQNRREPILDDLYVTIDDSQAPKGREPFVARHCPRSVKRYLAEAFIVKEDGTDKQLLDYLRKLMQPSVLLQLSEYFETGPARLVAHTDAYLYFNGTANELKYATENYFEPLKRRISTTLEACGALKRASGERLGDFDTFHTDLVTAVRKANVLEDLEKTLNEEQFRLRVPAQKTQVQVFGKTLDTNRSAFRCYVIDPLVVLKPFFDGIVNSAIPFQKQGYYTRRLRYDRPSPQFAPNNLDGFPVVKLVEHLLIFGFTSAEDFRQFQRSLILAQWTDNACSSVGALYLHNADATLLLSDGTLVQDNTAHDRFKTDGLLNIIASPKSCMVISLETWRTVEEKIFETNWTDGEPFSRYCVSFDIHSNG